MLPNDFDQWDIATEDGITVAMVCIVKDTLPITFNHFDETLLEFKKKYDNYKNY